MLLLGTVLASNKIAEVIKSKLSEPVNSNQLVKYDCPLKGKLFTDAYFTDYTVKKGDTLLSISKDQLGTTDRVLDIVIQNKDKFPQLSLENNFLEVGWTLKILKPQYGPYSYILRRVTGRIAEYSNNRIGMEWGTGDQVYFYPSEQTQLVGGNGFKVGDCVIITHAGLDLISIEHQN